MLSAAAIAAVRQPKRLIKKLDETQFKALIPTLAAPWRENGAGDLILPPSDQLSQKLYEQLVTRLYEGQNLPPVMFLAAYSSVQQNNVQVHRPEVCYPAAGFAIVKNELHELKLDGHRPIAARFLVAERGGRSEMILYWIRVDDAYAPNWISQRIAMAKANLEGYLPDGILTRMSLIGTDEDKSKEMLTRFANAMLKACSPEARRVIFGS